eukprot:677878-Prorocentrum_minimum.AAC.1
MASIWCADPPLWPPHAPLGTPYLCSQVHPRETLADDTLSLHSFIRSSSLYEAVFIRLFIIFIFVYLFIIFIFVYLFIIAPPTPAPWRAGGGGGGRGGRPDGGGSDRMF